MCPPKCWPGVPRGAHLVIPQAEVLLALLETALDGPAHPAHPHQRGRRCRGRRVVYSLVEWCTDPVSCDRHTVYQAMDAELACAFTIRLATMVKAVAIKLVNN